MRIVIVDRESAVRQGASDWFAEFLDERPHEDADIGELYFQAARRRLCRFGDFLGVTIIRRSEYVPLDSERSYAPAPLGDDEDLREGSNIEVLLLAGESLTPDQQRTVDDAIDAAALDVELHFEQLRFTNESKN